MFDYHRIIESAVETFRIAGSPLLNLITALVLVTIGLAAARLVQQFVQRVLKYAGFDTVTHALGIPKAVEGYRPSKVVADLAYWLTTLGTLVSVASLYGIVTPSYLGGLLFPYVSTVIRAVLVFGVALFLAGIVGGIVNYVGSTAGLHESRILGTMARYAIVGSSFIVVVAMLGIKTEWILASMTFVIGAVAAGIALAFGLGSKEEAGKFVTGLFKT